MNLNSFSMEALILTGVVLARISVTFITWSDFKRTRLTLVVRLPHVKRSYMSYFFLQSPKLDVQRVRTIYFKCKFVCCLISTFTSV